MVQRDDAQSTAAVCARHLGAFGQAPDVNERDHGGPPEVDGFVEAKMTEHQIPGVSVAVVREGRVVLAKGYGLANVEHSIPATEHTVYPLLSATKPFTGTAAMMLVEEGRLSLAEKLRQYLPNTPVAWSDITVRHLLTYTSGLPDCICLPPNAPDRADTPEEIIEKVARLPMVCSPGEQWVYHQTGIVLLGMIIERVSRQPYAEFVRERICQPLEMSATRFRDCSHVLDGPAFSADVIPNRATLYARAENTLQNKEVYFAPALYPCAGLWSTVSDLAKFDAALYTDRLLPRSRREEMWMPARLEDGGTADYGLGWVLGTYGGHRHVGHPGGRAVSHFRRFVDERLTVIVLTNFGSADYDLAFGIARFYLPAVKADGVPSG